MFNYDLSLRVTSSGSFLLPISPFGCKYTVFLSLSLLLQLVSLVNLLLFRDDGDVGVNQIGLQKD